MTTEVGVGSQGSASVHQDIMADTVKNTPTVSYHAARHRKNNNLPKTLGKKPTNIGKKYVTIKHFEMKNDHFYTQLQVISII